MADRDLDLAGRTLGDYLLRAKIGEGGSGVVYRAEQTSPSREVVVKVLHGKKIEKGASVERFLREAELASQLDHPYAAHVYASGVEEDEEDQQLWWIAMELVKGVTLADWLDTHGPMPLERFVPYFECVAEVVQEAHEHGIIHRDLKSDNMMVIERGGRLFPKLLDFGIAKVDSDVMLVNKSEADRVPTSLIRAAPREDVIRSKTGPKKKRELTRSGMVFGSAPYMAPEQWGNTAGVGPAADIYSLGVVIYEALTGRRPFAGKNTDEYKKLHRQGDVPPVGIAAPSRVSEEIDRVLQCALSKDPQDRQRSVLDLAADLRAVLRASDREQLRSAAQQWEDRARLPDLLWGDGMLADVGVMASAAAESQLTELECSFVVASQRRARRRLWGRRALTTLAGVVVVGVSLYYAVTQARQATLQTKLAQEQTRLTREVAEATVTQAELEQGRSALLHDEPEAQLHLSRAYQRGDRSPSTAFMLARALQPRLAEQARLTSTFGHMWSAAFSPEGRQIVTTDDRAAQVWDAQTYRRMFTLFHGDTVYQARYSADGARLVTAGGDGTVKIWDTASGTLVRELRRDGARLRYFLAALSPDGRLVSAIDTRGDVAHVWDAFTGAPIAEIRNDGLKSPCIAFSPDGRWLATTGGSDVHVLDTRTWRPALTIRGSRIHRLAFDPTGSRLVTGATTGVAAIWSIPSGARIRHLRDVGGPVDAVAFSPDGQLVVSGSRDGAVQIWRAGSGELQSQLNPLPLPNLSGRVRPDLQACARRRRGRDHQRCGSWPGNAGRRARRAAECPGSALRPCLAPHRQCVPGQHRPGLGRDPAVPSLELVACRRQLRPEPRARPQLYRRRLQRPHDPGLGHGA